MHTVQLSRIILATLFRIPISILRREEESIRDFINRVRVEAKVQSLTLISTAKSGSDRIWFCSAAREINSFYQTWGDLITEVPALTLESGMDEDERRNQLERHVNSFGFTLVFWDSVECILTPSNPVNDSNRVIDGNRFLEAAEYSLEERIINEKVRQYYPGLSHRCLATLQNDDEHLDRALDRPGA